MSLYYFMAFLLLANLLQAMENQADDSLIATSPQPLIDKDGFAIPIAPPSKGIIAAHAVTVQENKSPSTSHRKRSDSFINKHPGNASSTIDYTLLKSFQD